MPRSWRLSTSSFRSMAAGRVLVGVHPQVAVLADREISLAPTGDVVELGGFGGGPAVGRLTDRARCR